MWRRGQKRRKPLTERELLEQTLDEIAQHQRRREMAFKRLYRRGRVEWFDRRVAAAVLVVVVAFLADGVRRENAEFVATLTQATGLVYVQHGEEGRQQGIAPPAQLSDGDIVSTAAGAYATLEFTDGSVITLAPGTVFRVCRLEYSRGGRWKVRSFRVEAGQIWAKVSRYFGRGSEMRVYTPAAVAAVRGTVFAVRYDPRVRQAEVVCQDWAVAMCGWRGNAVMVARGAKAQCAYGAPAAPPQRGRPEEFAGFGIAALHRPDVPDTWLKRAELWVTYVLDLPLSVLGIGRCSWGVGSADYARRAAAMEALRRIHLQLETFTVYPDFVDPVTLRELGLPADKLKRLMSAFYGGAIERYYKVGRGFVLYARARDKRRTLYKLTPYGVEKGTPEDERWASIGW